MCRFCTQPWAEGVGECMVGENGLRYHSPACYQSYLDGIAKVTPPNHSLHKSFTIYSKEGGDFSSFLWICSKLFFTHFLWKIANLIESINHQRILAEANVMEDPVAAEAHRMTSRTYRNNKEVTSHPSLSIIHYKITQREGGDSLPSFGDYPKLFFTLLYLDNY